MTAVQEPALALTATRPRLVVAMDNRYNAVLVGRALEELHDITLDVPAHAVAFQGVDLVIVDGVSLHRYLAILGEARARASPLQLPVLLLTDRDEPFVLAPALEAVVDDIIRRPLTKAELAMRVRTLLRSRRLSADIARVQGLYETERTVANRFQEAALPRALPAVRGVDLSAYYQPGHRDVSIGGDWYDALALEDGRVVLSVGDVCGSGLDAAVLMAHVRQVIRGVAHIHPDPQMMLDAVNRNLNAEHPDRIVTAVAAVFDPISSTLHYANAGHCPAVLRRPDGSIEILDCGDLPLGVGSDPPAGRVAHMPPDSVLLMYTDGLVEFDRDVIGNQTRLERLLASRDPFAESDPAPSIFERIVHGNPPDDVAILLVRRNDHASDRRAWRFKADDPAAFSDLRAEIRAELASSGYTSEEQITAEIILSELVANVVRYATGTVEIVLDRSPGRATLHVLDFGPSFQYAPRLPANPLSETGRGLYLVKQLSRDFSVSARPDGGSHARATLR